MGNFRSKKIPYLCHKTNRDILWPPIHSRHYVALTTKSPIVATSGITLVQNFTNMLQQFSVSGKDIRRSLRNKRMFHTCAQETTTFRNPPIQNFTWDKKNVTRL